ncbi:MAG: hypothetical protein LBE70_02695 [Nitrososphaerota archaeon]|jgi:DNA-directed RNA polymerase subunit RPC12/RpoP|nr:hypothetical protein [Nitrososphaerota archaeon]
MQLNIIITISLSIAVIIVLITSMVGVLMNRGKQLKCPDCNHVCPPPALDQKYIGLGWSFPYMGAVICPNCGNKRLRRNYNKVEHQVKEVK